MDRRPIVPIEESDSDSYLFRGFRLLTMQSGRRPYGSLNGYSLWTQGGKIAWIGDGTPPDAAAGSTVVEGHERCLSPGLIDCHTHHIYGGNRADEWEQRLSGVPYEEIARLGGGILSAVKATRNASEDELFADAKARLLRFLRQGVTTVEIKSGYGLDLETEWKLLRVASRLEQALPVRVLSTLLAAHAVPAEYENRADDYIEWVCNTMIPASAELCTAVDVFCESIAFDIDQTRRVFNAARQNKLDIKVHAEQLTHSGGAVLAAEMGALSADHLEFLPEAACAVLASHKTVATLLPGSFYTLHEQQRPPVRALRACGATIAIASDANPGSSPLASILLVANMACNLFGLTAEESIAGLTRNAARALGLEDEVGTLQVGMQADLALWNIRTPAELAYGVGHNPCLAVFQNGKIAWQSSVIDSKGAAIDG